MLLGKNFDVRLLPQSVEPALLGLDALLLNKVFFDLFANVADRLHGGASLRFDHDNIIGVFDTNDRAYLARPQRKCHIGELFIQSVPLNPPPVSPTLLRRLILRIHLRHTVEFRASGDLLADLFREFLLASYIRHVAR